VFDAAGVGAQERGEVTVATGVCERRRRCMLSLAQPECAHCEGDASAAVRVFAGGVKSQVCESSGGVIPDTCFVVLVTTHQRRDVE
jgi:hypothetical protein